MRMAFVLAAAAAAFPSICGAQWSDDPAVNTAIADRSGEQVQAKIRARADGGCYISWFDNSTGGYDVYVQRLDAQGNELWAHNGVLVRDRGVSSTQDYDLEVDAAGFAFVVFNDDVNGNAPITAQLIAPDGQLLWGATGVQVSGAQTGFKGPPQATVLSDGTFAVVWSNGSPSALHVQKLDLLGGPVWPAPVVLSEASRPFNTCDIQAGEAGSMILSWVRCGGTNCVTSTKHLYAQKLSAAGAPMWDRDPGTPMSFEPMIVFDGTSLQTANFPPFVSDGAGGAVFAWYETGGNRDAYVQRIHADGYEMFDHNGVSVSTQVNRLQLGAALSFDASTGDAYVAWVESNSGQSQWGLYAQKISDEGVRAWGENGVELLGLSGVQGSFTATLARAGGGVDVFGFANCCGNAGNVHGFALDADGAALWPGQPVAVCSVTSSKARISAARGADGASLIAWSDNRADSNNVYAQRVNTDGTLGNGPVEECAADFDGNGEVQVPDIFAFLSAWFAGDASADLDGTPGIGVPDIFAFLSLWFAGCP